jgi:TM2 domain-containing membrane protein YozV
MSNPGAGFCPYCGKQVAAADAMFCEHCGRALPGATASDPNNVTQQGAIGAMSGGSTVATATSARVVVTTPTKSRGIAVLLELFIPGAGAMYLERVGLGIAWLAGSVIGGVIAIVAYNAAVQSAMVGAAEVVDCYAPNACSGVGETVTIGMAVIICLSVAWFIVRCVLVSRYARMYNSRLQS